MRHSARWTNSIRAGLISACCGLALAVQSAPAWAQAQAAAPAPQAEILDLMPQPVLPAPSALERARAVRRARASERLRLIPLRNIPAPIMAFLLDPQHQPEPLIFGSSRRNSHDMPDDGMKSFLATFPVPALPPGVSVEALTKPMEALLLSGPPEAVASWAAAISVLDKPLRQVEIEAQMVQLPRSALKDLQVPTDSPGPHLLAGDASARLRQLLQSKQARLVSAPRVTAIAGLTASLSSTTSIPAHIVPDLEGGQKSGEFVPPGRIWIARGIGLTVRPTLRANDEIDMELAAGTSWHIQSALGAIPLRLAQRASFLAHDGSSYLLYARPGFASPAFEVEPVAPFASADAAAPKPPEPALVAGAQDGADGLVSAFIVCARIIRRAPFEQEAQQIQELIDSGAVRDER